MKQQQVCTLLCLVQAGEELRSRVLLQLMVVQQHQQLLILHAR